MGNFIELIDGTHIEAFPKTQQPEVISEDELAIDTTGKYLQTGQPKIISQSSAGCDELKKKWQELFIRNAHRLIAESDTILADSRMFLAPVPIQSGIAYTGRSGFQNPTLGVYIEWWKYNECAWVNDNNGAKLPIYYITGSPLTGTNKCAYVGIEGESCSVSIPSFASVWPSFVKVNTRYAEAKQLYEAYTIEEVINKLFG